MNMQKLKNNLRFMPLVLLAALSACNNGGGKSNNAPTNLQLSGVNYGGFQNTGFQSCNFVNNNSYQCNETNFGVTPIIPFNSQQELCINLRNEALHYPPGSSYGLASSVRDNYVRANCQAYGSNFGNSTTQYDTNLLRTMKCTMSVEGIDGAFGNSGEMIRYLVASGDRGQITAQMNKERRGSIFSWTTSRSSRKYLNVDYIYTKGTNGNGDQLTLKAGLDGASAEITGFAGSEVSLVIDNVNPVVKAEVSCSISDAANAGVQTASNEYRCNVAGTDNVEKSPVVLSVSELLNNSISLTGSESLTNVTMNAEGSFALRQGTAVYTATRQSSKYGMMNISGRANLSTQTKFKVRQLSKSVDISCK